MVLMYRLAEGKIEDEITFQELPQTSAPLMARYLLDHSIIIYPHVWVQQNFEVPYCAQVVEANQTWAPVFLPAKVWCIIRKWNLGRLKILWLVFCSSDPPAPCNTFFLMERSNN